MQKNRQFLISIFFVLLIFNLGFSNGTLIGLVSDAINDDPLAGANILVKNTSLGGSTDINGEFRISGIPEGSFIVEVLYVGYLTETISIDIISDKTEAINIALKPAVMEGDEIVITAQAEGQIAAINQQVNSNTIVNVVSEEKIQELPDANAAEAIGRLPGVSITRTGGEANKVLLRGMDAKFSPITIDGVRIATTDETGRGVDLSMLSQNSLAGIELYKAVTPDMDGDALSGSINLVTKKAPDSRQFKINMEGNYNKLTESYNQYDFSFRYGERFFNSIFGVQLAGNLEKKNRSKERIDVSDRYDKPINKYVIDNFNVEFTDEIRTRNGFSVLLDFDTPDDGTIKLNNVFGSTKRDYLTHFRDYPLDGEATTYDYRLREQNITTFNSSIHGDNYLLGLKFKWGLSYAESKSEHPFDYQMIFYDSNDMSGTVKFYDYKEIPEKLIPLSRNDFSQAYQAWGYFRKQDNIEKDRTAFVDISRNYSLINNISGKLKIGAKYKINDRNNKTGEDFSPYYLDGRWKADELIVDGSNISIIPKDFTGSYFEDWYNEGGGFISLDHFFNKERTRNVYGDYRLAPLMSKSRLKQWQKLNKNGIDPTGNQKEVWNNPLYQVNDYDISESVSALYLMNTLKIGQNVTFISGVRAEKENNDYSGYYMKSKAGGFPLGDSLLFDTTSVAKQTVILPNFHLAYSPTKYLKIRLAAYKALARPDFNMRIDRYIAGRGSLIGSPFVVQVGNIKLKTAQAWNYEFNTSIYNQNIGLISLSAFYKKIDDMYHMLNRFGTKGDSTLNSFGIYWTKQMETMGTTSYELSLPYNSDKPTKVWGIEFEHQVNFHFLPGFLKGFVLSYNASIVRSETYVYSAKIDSTFEIIFPPDIGVWKKYNILNESKTKLEGQPEFFGNISIGYDFGGFSGRVSLFHQAEYNDALRATNNSYTINKAFTRVDLALKQKITKKISAYFNMNNITNVEEGNYNYDGFHDIKRFNRSEKYGMTIDLGVIAEF